MAKRKKEFIPLGYDERGRVVDVAGNLREVEAISYGLDAIYIEVGIDSNPFLISREIIGCFKGNVDEEMKKNLGKNLEGRLGFISKISDIEDPDGKGTWISVQLYRIKD